MIKYLAPVMALAVCGIVAIVWKALDMGIDTGVSTAAISALSALFTGGAGAGVTYMVMRKRR